MDCKMTTPTAIEARDLSFGYESGLALTNVNFTLGEGELLALIGPNGSGKTTLLKLLLGILRPSSGAVELFDAPLSSYAPKERAKLIAYVSQQPVLSFPLTVFELVALGRYPHDSRFGLSVADLSAVEEALDHTASRPLAARRFTTLSGGEQQKILIARALAQSARILLLDEPTLHLDLHYQLQILAGLKRLCAQKCVTIVTVLHDLNLVSLFADKALLLNGGKLRAFGPVAEVVTECKIKELLSVDIKAMTDTATGIRYFVPRRPR
ncbi:MAG: ABC transporter ATP-binding protein [Chloroflexota bacterium]